LEDVLEAVAAYWRTVLAALMSTPSVANPAWQERLLNLVFPDLPPPFPQASISLIAFPADNAGHNVSMPTGVGAGDLLIVFFANDGGATVSTTTTGWTLLFTGASGDQVRLSAYAKVAAGNESGTALAIQTSAGEHGVAHVFHIRRDTWFGG